VCNFFATHICSDISEFIPGCRKLISGVIVLV
jgi:hypothetical protein